MNSILIRLLYPNVCGICGNINNEYICPKCRYKLKSISRAKIIECETKKFNEQAFLFNYDDIIRKRLLEYKFYEAGYLYKTFAEAFIENKKILNFLKTYDIIIPIPVHKKRKIQRGYDQTELIAKELSKKTGIIIENNILIKEKNTKPQSTLNKEKRNENAKGVYKVIQKDKIKGKKVLLLDDIYTTGSTADECSRMIRKGLPKKIGILTIAKD